MTEYFVYLYNDINYSIVPYFLDELSPVVGVIFLSVHTAAFENVIILFYGN